MKRKLAVQLQCSEGHRKLRLNTALPICKRFTLAGQTQQQEFPVREASQLTADVLMLTQEQKGSIQLGEVAKFHPKGWSSREALVHRD